MQNFDQRERVRSLSKNEIGKVFRDFCQSTTLHGYHYLYDNESHILMKIIWFFVIMAMTGLGILFLAVNTKQFLDQKILSTVESFSAPLTVSDDILETHN